MVVVGVVLVGGGVVVLAWSAIHTLSVTREKEIYHQQIKQPRHPAALAQEHEQLLPVGLKSFPGMYASSLMLEKVTVAPSTSKEAGLIQR